jgi:Zn-dependent alcohol dehydrogenase
VDRAYSFRTILFGDIEVLTRSRELHLYRGVEPTEPDFIMGHEFTGTVVSLGSAVKSVNIGDKVVSPFTASWFDLL